MRLNEYTTLGRTGLRISPLCLGAMGFGTGWGWGADEKASVEMLNLYLEGGGNFIDTADGYQMGQSEEIEFGKMSRSESFGTAPSSPRNSPSAWSKAIPTRAATAVRISTVPSRSFPSPPQNRFH